MVIWPTITSNNPIHVGIFGLSCSGVRVDLKYWYYHYQVLKFKSHSICSSHEKYMNVQELYHFTLNGLETFHWQPTSSSARLDLWERKGDEGALRVHAAHLRPLRCDMVSWAAAQNMLRDVMSTFLHCSTTVQTELITELFMITTQQCSPVHTAHRYSCWTHYSALIQYNMFICTVQSKTAHKSPADKSHQWCNSLEGVESLPNLFRFICFNYKM